MLTKKEMRIVDLFRTELGRKETVHNIMKLIGTSSYSWVFNTVKKLSAAGVFDCQKKGNSVTCSLNLDSFEAISYLAISEQTNCYSAKHLPHENILEMINSISSGFFTFIIAGSYAAGKQKAGSDLDVCVIVDDSANTKRVYNQIMAKAELLSPKTHLFVFTAKEFLKMLSEKEENYGKLVHRKKLIYFGAENYYLILKEAIAHGFRG